MGTTPARWAERTRLEAAQRLRPRAANSTTYPGPTVYQKQTAAYPDIAPLSLDVSPQVAYDTAYAIVTKRKWAIVDARFTGTDGAMVDGAPTYRTVGTALTSLPANGAARIYYLFGDIPGGLRLLMTLLKTKDGWRQTSRGAWALSPGIKYCSSCAAWCWTSCRR